MRSPCLLVQSLEDGQEGERVAVRQTTKRGQVFCFLPLPVDSGLPVFVNGYFELSSNRRDIWSGGGQSYSIPLPIILTAFAPHFLISTMSYFLNSTMLCGADMTGEGKQRSDWNQALLSDVVTPLYADLMESLVRNLPMPDSLAQYYTFFPSPKNTQKYGCAHDLNLYIHVSSYYHVSSLF
jgi:sacsin